MSGLPGWEYCPRCRVYAPTRHQITIICGDPQWDVRAHVSQPIRDHAAIVIDPGNEDQLSAVTGQIEIVCSDGNSDARRVAKYILTALNRLDEQRRKGES